MAAFYKAQVVLLLTDILLLPFCCCSFLLLLLLLLIKQQLLKYRHSSGRLCDLPATVDCCTAYLQAAILPPQLHE